MSIARTSPRGLTCLEDEHQDKWLSQGSTFHPAILFAASHLTGASPQLTACPVAQHTFAVEPEERAPAADSRSAPR